MPVTDRLRDSIFTRIDSLSPQQLDDLPIGAIQLDRSGNILQFNSKESQLANLDRSRVIGKNFFKDIAPCTDVQEFHGRFRQGLAARKLHEKFRYHFAFKQNPRDVLVTLYYSDFTDTIWVFVDPISQEHDTSAK